MKSLKFLISPWVNYIFNVKGYPKLCYHIFLPCIFTALSIVICGSLNQVENISSSSANFLLFLAGFSFVALIALPSIKSKTLNSLMYGNKFGKSEVIPVVQKKLEQGFPLEQHISRKQFLAFLLSYICFMSVVLMAVSSIGFSDPIYRALISADNIYWINNILSFSISVVKIIYIYAFFDLIINMLYAIQYFAKTSLEDGQ